MKTYRVYIQWFNELDNKLMLVRADSEEGATEIAKDWVTAFPREGDGDVYVTDVTGIVEIKTGEEIVSLL